MNRAEAAQLLALCSAFDNRTIGDTDVLAWADVLANVPYVDAQAAVKGHYALETRRVMPADVVAGVKRIRQARMDGADASFVFVGDPDDVDEYQRQLAAHRKTIGDGAGVPSLPALTRPVSPRAIDGVFRSVPRRDGAA